MKNLEMIRAVRLEDERDRLRAALEHIRLVAETDDLPQWVKFCDDALNRVPRQIISQDPQWVRDYETKLMSDGGPSSPKPVKN